MDLEEFSVRTDRLVSLHVPWICSFILTCVLTLITFSIIVSSVIAPGKCFVIIISEYRSSDSYHNYCNYYHESVEFHHHIIISSSTQWMPSMYCCLYNIIL